MLSGDQRPRAEVAPADPLAWRDVLCVLRHSRRGGARHSHLRGRRLSWPSSTSARSPAATLSSSRSATPSTSPTPRRRPAPTWCASGSASRRRLAGRGCTPTATTSSSTTARRRSRACFTSTCTCCPVARRQAVVRQGHAAPSRPGPREDRSDLARRAGGNRRRSAGRNAMASLVVRR